MGAHAVLPKHLQLSTFYLNHCYLYTHQRMVILVLSTVFSWKCHFLLDERLESACIDGLLAVDRVVDLRPRLESAQK